VSLFFFQNVLHSLDAICDVLADCGYAVCMPSLFGDLPFDLAVNGPADGEFEKFNSFAQEGGVAWFQQQTYEKLKPVVAAGYEYLQAQQNADDTTPIMVLGFCFGTWLLSKASVDFAFAAAVGCHPATILESAVYEGDEMAMLHALRQPTLFLWAGNDSDIYVGDDGAGKKALVATGGGVEEFPEMLHGWVSRGDVSDAAVQRDFAKAMTMIVSFMDSRGKGQP
jgi:dienelactone hydrolase